VSHIQLFTELSHATLKGKGKGFPYSILSVGPRVDPGVQAVCPQVTISHPPCGRLPLLSARLAVQRKGKEEYLYSAYLAKVVHSKCSGMDHTVLPANNTMPAFPS